VRQGDQRRAGLLGGSPTLALGLTDVVDISLSGNTACAVLGDGSVWCWGENERGSLGFESPVCGPFEIMRDVLEYYDLPCQAEPTQVPGLADVVEVAVGGVHQCARHIDGSVSCWGAENQWGILGDGTDVDPLTVEPRVVEGLSGIVQLEAGWYFTCALDDEGQVWCWGGNSQGTLGLGTSYQQDPSRMVPTLVPGLSDIVRISAKNSSVCAIDEQGAVWCWGDTNYLFPAGHSPSAVSRAPEPVEFGGAAAVEIDSNGFTTCILDVDNHVRCRGLAVANGSSDWTDYSGDPVLWDPS
jgi:alpha-tubulin suppressor-like RCC1 family protein